jgi:ubiquitin
MQPLAFHQKHRFKFLNLVFAALLLCAFGALAQTNPAQSAPKSIVSQAQARQTVLPLRNLLVEVRQVGSDAEQRSSIDAQGRVILQPGRSRGEGVVSIEQGRSQQDRRLEQQALVLNGRSVSFSIGQTVPMRVVQVLAFNGNLHFVPSAILIDRNSGFSALPLWYGDDVAEVEISTMRSPGNSSAQGNSTTQGVRQSKASTTLHVQINEWITIAQSEDSSNSSASGILSQSGEQKQSNLRVEMRVTVK